MKVRNLDHSYLKYKKYGHIARPFSRYLSKITNGNVLRPYSRYEKRDLLNVDSLYEKTSNEANLFKIPNRDTSLILNLFFQSLVVGDISTSKEYLNKLTLRVKRNPTINNVTICYSCFTVILAHESTGNKTLNVLDVKGYIAMFLSFHKSVQNVSSQEIDTAISTIKIKIIQCLIRAFEDINQDKKAYRYNVASFAIQVMKDFKISLEQVRVSIDNQTLNASFDKLLQLKGIYSEESASNSKSGSEKNKATSIDPLRDEYGLLSFTNLCRYISSTKYVHEDESLKGMKLYEAYDKMSEDEKNRFMDKYKDFNRRKEMEIESVSLDLIDSELVLGDKASTVKSSETFKIKSASLLREWYDSSLKSVNRYINTCNILEDDSHLFQSEPEESNGIKRCISDNLFFFNILEVKQLVLAIVSHLFSKTIQSETGYVKVIDLIRDLNAFARRSVYTDKDNSAVKSELLKFFNEENAVELLSALVKIVLESCKIKSNIIDAQNLEEFYALIEHPTSKIDEGLLKPESGMYLAFKWGLINESSENKFKLGVIKIHPYLLQTFKATAISNLTRSLYLPMLVPPKEWKSPIDGGYLNDSKPVVNSTDLNTALEYLQQAHKTGQLTSTYKALNVLGSCAWAVNDKVLNAFNQVMQDEQGFLKIPPPLYNLSVDAGSTQVVKSDAPDETDYYQSGKMDKRMKSKRIKEFHNRKSLRMNYQMIQSVANAYGCNGDMIYLPHNIDFRGRAYPMVSVLSHYQEDLVRSLMMFWHSKPLGEYGFDWLKYQLAGLYGEDKLTKEGRIQFVNNNITMIIDSAKDPLNGKRWWTTAQNPWQVFGLCVEIDNILNFEKDGGIIQDYKCRIPIHQDGSCNGLQHYAALGLDSEGARAVNLRPSQEGDKKEDVYNKVLEIVKGKIESDSKSPIFETRKLASASNELLSRKLIKQTIMTSVYGVTTYGGAAQIQSKIDELVQVTKFNNSYSAFKDLDFIETNGKRISLYLSQLVLGSVSDLFSGARRIQEWLYESSLRILYSLDLQTIDYSMRNDSHFDFFRPKLYRPLMWTSVSGLPIVQLYKNNKSTIVKTPLQSIKLDRPSKISTVNIQKQLNAFAPNFIHSLDSTHMLMSVIEADCENITFVSVHDSYWTHPSDVDSLAKIIRAEFVRLYTVDVLGHLKDDMQHTVQNKFQLVWIENDRNQELVNEINKLRESYFENSLTRTKNWNRALIYELKSLSENSDTRCLEIMKKYDPTVYFKGRQSSRKLIDYIHNKDARKVYDHSHFTPVLHPVIIPPKPSTGDFDIKEVMHSWYFFS